jgi:hypothetical protein
MAQNVRADRISDPEEDKGYAHKSDGEHGGCPGFHQQNPVGCTMPVNRHQDVDHTHDVFRKRICAQIESGTRRTVKCFSTR